jgi:hypothetical protein
MPQVKRLASLVPNIQRKDGVSKIERLEREFGPDSDDDDDDPLDARAQRARAKKPADFLALFQVRANRSVTPPPQ